MFRSFVALLLVLLHAAPSFSCSAFAVYGNAPVYGMNFDYAAFPMKLHITEVEGGSHLPSLL